MTAQQFVAAGADEIQHLNFIVLNFLEDKVQDPRGTARFTAVAEHAAELGPDNPKVEAFIAYLKANDTKINQGLTFGIGTIRSGFPMCQRCASSNWRASVSY